MHSDPIIYEKLLMLMLYALLKNYYLLVLSRKSENFKN